MEKLKTYTDVPMPPRSVGVDDVRGLAVGHSIHVDTEIQAESARVALRSLGRFAKRRVDATRRGGYYVWRIS